MPSFDLDLLQLPKRIEITNEGSYVSTDNDFVVLVPGGGGSG